MRKFRITLLLIAVTILFAAANDAFAQKPVKDESLRKGETRTTLNPNLFNDSLADPRIKKAYQVAKEIPWVLDSIYCYCMCEESPTFRHKSLLSCYVDNHAAM
ncbi:MAG: hypothetical protein M1147_01725 [Nitrospirae bacterium]|nr:hypothetical protein [Nitrospirota bacterium]MCL5976829.1 hypothetical protein [Nitrospirota bacterium]